MSRPARHRFSFLLAPFAYACQLGTSDIHIGFHVSSNTASSVDAASSVSDDAHEASSVAADCTLLRSEGPVAYAIGDVGRLDGVHILTAKHSGKCAEARGCDSDQALAEQSTCDVSRCQMWQSLEVADGWFAINNAKTGGCLDVGNGSMIDGGTIQAWACHARVNQQWQAVCAGDDSWRIINRNSSLLLRVVGTNDGDIAQQWSDVGSNSERWTITSQPDAYAPLLATSEESGQTWRRTLQAPAMGWEDPAFDDSAWEQSLAPFGTRYEYPWAPRTDWSTTDIWLRRELTLAAAPASLDVRIFHNGPAEVYVNGNLAYQGASSVGYRVSPANEAATASLVVGTNTVAVHCRQNADQSFGPFIDMGLGRFVWH